MASSMDDEKRASLRMPADLQARLIERARTVRQSLNSKCIHLFEVALGPTGAHDKPP
jgi:hypothetical protein